MFTCLIFQAIKGFLQKSIVFITSIILYCWPRKSSTANPILPIKNPAPTSEDNYNIQENDQCDDNIVVDVPEETICSSDEEMCRWIKHYSSRQRILVVGDGDFSFSVSLALAFGSASNMISTSLDSKAFLRNNYQNALFNITELRSRKCMVMHGIDATNMANHVLLRHLEFDRIIFNFPYAGFFKNLPRETQLRHHKRLVSLFLKNAREMISEDGEIHITHKTNGFHVEWKLESVASRHGLRLIEAVKFNHLEYPGYNTKYGFGGNNNFNCNPSKTYKFRLETACYSANN